MAFGRPFSLLACLALAIACGGKQEGEPQPDGGLDGGEGGGDTPASIFCLDDTECPDGMVCNPFSNRCSSPPPDGGTVECHSDEDCLTGERCRYGKCEEVPELPGLGEPCELTCQEGLVCISLRGEPSTCHQICSASDPCQANEHCVLVEGTETGVCEEDCDIYANDCPSGMTCLPLTDGGYACFEAGTAGVGQSCDPSRTDACAAGLICEGSSRTCAEVCDPTGARKSCPPQKECVQPEGAEFGVCR